MTTKGLPFRCTFCTTKVSGNKARKRSPKLFIDEIKSLIDTIESGKTIKIYHD